MLTITGLEKRLGGNLLFQDVTLQINRQDRVGLVGANGSGKTTLFSLILGVMEPDAGSISWQRGITVGYLPQESAPIGEETVLELACRWSAPGSEPHEAASDHTANAEDAGKVEARARQILAALAFREKDFSRPARELSGGWVMRAHLARLLVQQPDLLMLDEPTNHLDLETLQWFQGYLRTYPGAVLVISHDRAFLNELVDTVAELRMNQLTAYRGNYDSYLEQRAEREAQQLAAYKNQQREINRLMRFVERFRAKNTKAAQAQSKLKQIERMDLIAAPDAADSEIDFSFPQPERSGLKVISLKNLDHAYGAQTVYRGLDFEAERGQRIVLAGPNGAGKSTLLKLLAGVLPVQSGERVLGARVQVGYYAQYRIENLNPDRTALEEALMTPQRVTEQFVRDVLGCFLFRGDDVHKPVRVLSGGEKSRLALVKLLLDPPNLLLMDEPTTHLDLASVDALITALSGYQGTLLFISHDVYFIRALAEQVMHVQNGRLTWFAGGYDYYCEKRAAEEQRSALYAPPPPPVTAAAPRPRELAREQKRLEAEARVVRAKARREQEHVVRDLEERIAQAEARHAELMALVENPETYRQPGAGARLNLELTEVSTSLAHLNQEWEAAASRLQELTAPAQE